VVVKGLATKENLELILQKLSRSSRYNIIKSSNQIEEEYLKLRNTSGAANKLHIVDLSLGDIGSLEESLDPCGNASEEVRVESLELLTSNLT